MFTKLVKLNQVTLTPQLLYTTTPDAPSGRVHASAVRLAVEDGTEYTRDNESPDVLINDAAIAAKARELYELVAARLATDAGSAVRHRPDAPPISAAR